MQKHTLTRTKKRRPAFRWTLLITAINATSCFAGEDNLSELALEDLLNISVSSVSRYDQPTTEAPASVTVIDKYELRHHGYRNLAEALVTVPGVYASGDRSYTYLGIRGFNRPGNYGTRLLLLTDGARRNDPLYDQALLGNESPIEIDWVKRLEFVSGPASSIYGPNAVFGTANTVMLDGGDINGARISLDAGTHNTKRLGVVAGQRLPDDRDWFIGFAAYKSNGENLYFREYDDGTTNGRSRGLDGENYQKIYAKYRWGNWRLTGNFSQREKDDPTANFGTTFGLKGSDATDKNQLIELRYDEESGKTWQPSFRLYHGGYRYTGNYNYSPSPNGRDIAIANWSGSEFRLAYNGFSQHRLIVGIDAQWNHQLEQRYYEVAPYASIHDSNHPSHSMAIYAQDEWRFAPDWLLNLSARYDKHSDFSAVTSPRAALVWQASPRITLKAISGSSYRVPNVFERYYTDNDVSQIANPDLKPEYIQTNELSAAYRFGATGQVGIAAYQNKMRDMIDQTEVTSGVHTYTNRDRVSARGVEVNAENQWSWGLRLRGSLGWQRSEMEDGTLLVDSPQRMAKLVASVPVAFGWTAAGEIIALSSRKGDNGSVPGYVRGNLSLTSAPDKHYGQFSLSIYNLGNQRYDDPASTSLLQRSIEQPGRQFRLRWTLSL